MEIERQSLKKELSMLSLFTIAFGTIIGIGWITVLGAWLTDAGPMGAVIGFVIGGLFMLTIGLCYSEAATMYPVSGGEVAYVYEMFGTRWSFVTGWFLALDYIGATAFEAIAVGWVLSALFPDFGGPVIYTILGHGVRLWTLLVGLGIMAIIAVINYRGAKSAAILQDALTFTLLAASLVFVFVGIVWGDPANLKPMFVGSGLSGATVGILAIVATAPFWFAGFDTIPQAMGEIKSGASLKSLSKVIGLAIGLAAVFYCLVIIAASMSLPREELLSHELPVAGALEAAFDSAFLGNLVLFAGLLGLITTWNAVFFAASRVVFALGRAHMIPSRFASVHERFGSPYVAVLFVAIVGSIGALFGRNAILPIVAAASLILATIFLIIIVGTARLRRTKPDHPRPFKVPGGMAFFFLAGACAIGVVVLAINEGLGGADGGFPPEWIVLILWGVLGAVFWVAAAKMRNAVSSEERRYLILNEEE